MKARKTLGFLDDLDSIRSERLHQFHDPLEIFLVSNPYLNRVAGHLIDYDMSASENRGLLQF